MPESLDRHADQCNLYRYGLQVLAATASALIAGGSPRRGHFGGVCEPTANGNCQLTVATTHEPGHAACDCQAGAQGEYNSSDPFPEEGYR